MKIKRVELKKKYSRHEFRADLFEIMKKSAFTYD